jgi:hypothetical protein
LSWPNSLRAAARCPAAASAVNQPGVRLLVEGLVLAQPPQVRKHPLVPPGRRRGAGEPQHGMAVAASDLGHHRVSLQQVHARQHLTAPQPERPLVQPAGVAALTRAAAAPARRVRAPDSARSSRAVPPSRNDTRQAARGRPARDRATAAAG